MRARAEPELVYRDASLGSYILVNPLADETDELKRLDVSPDSCIKADCYWKCDGDVYFLQIETTLYVHREAGLWARVSPGEPSYLNLVGVVVDRVVTRNVVHHVMRLFQRMPIHAMRPEPILRRLDTRHGGE
jgi:hypothetical protein